MVKPYIDILSRGLKEMKEKISDLASEHEILWKNATALIGVVHRKDAEKEQLEQIKINVLEKFLEKIKFALNYIYDLNLDSLNKY